MSDEVEPDPFVDEAVALLKWLGVPPQKYTVGMTHAYLRSAYNKGRNEILNETIADQQKLIGTVLKATLEQAT